MKGPAAKLVRQGLKTTTDGLAAFGHPEVTVTVADRRLLAEAGELLSWIAGYVRDRKAKLRPGERMVWGYWQIRFLLRGDGLEIHEADPDGDMFSPGATRTLTYLVAQEATCRRLSSVFSPPMLDGEARVSPAVLDGAWPLRAERDFAIPPDTGWTFTAAGDDPEDLAPIPICRVSAARPGIAPYLALVDGFRVVLTEDGEQSAEYVEDPTGTDPTGT